MPIIQLHPAGAGFGFTERATRRATVSAEELQQRLVALQALAVLDTPPDEGLDALTRLAANVFDMPIALVSLIDGERLWFKAAYGLEATAADSSHSFCCENANAKTVLEVGSARLDTRFAKNDMVTGPLAIQYYAGAPIFYRGVAIGTVCVLDYVPRKASRHALYALEEMATIATALLRAPCRRIYAP